MGGLNETARSWLLLATIAVSAFGAGAGFMGWIDIPSRVRGNKAAVSVLSENQLMLARQLAVTRCTVEDMTSYECDQLQRQIRQRLEDPSTVGPGRVRKDD